MYLLLVMLNYIVSSNEVQFAGNSNLYIVENCIITRTSLRLITVMSCWTNCLLDMVKRMQLNTINEYFVLHQSNSPALYFYFLCTYYATATKELKTVDYN